MRESKESYVVDSRGKRKAVILPIKRFNDLMEDLHDLTVIAERRSEPTISIKEVRRRLRKSGHI